MRKLGITAALLLLSAAMAVGQTSQSSDQQSTTDKAKGAASSTAGAVKSGAETGYDKTKEGTEKAYGATKNAVTGSSDQTTEQQTSTENTTTTANKKLPQTASPLPLLGLLGLGAFSVGAWKFRFSHS